MALVGVLGAAMVNRPGTYYGRVNVVLVPPEATNPTAADNPLERRIQTTVDFAGIVAKEVGSLSATKVYVSSRVTLQDEDVPHGWSVRQPADGSQWDLIFDQPIVEVQVTGMSADEVRTRIDEVVGRIEGAAVARQDAAGVAPPSRVDFILSPSIPIITYADGSTIRALVALAIVCGLSGWAASAVVGRVVGSRAPRGGRVPSSRAEAPPQDINHRLRATGSIEREVVKT